MKVTKGVQYKVACLFVQANTYCMSRIYSFVGFVATPIQLSRYSHLQYEIKKLGGP